jgi:hypothetical protein
MHVRVITMCEEGDCKREIVILYNFREKLRGIQSLKREFQWSFLGNKLSTCPVNECEKE